MKLQATYGFTIVLDPTMSGGIVFVDPATDITDAVVQETAASVPGYNRE